ncbi:MAG TPA: YdcH family protein [Aliidongia sp.]|nr:YdcH family protein [Aliidongia sp.]
MAVEDHIRALRDKHATIDKAILKEESRSLPDDTKVTEWKREKLRIKDQIADLSRHQMV